MVSTKVIIKYFTLTLCFILFIYSYHLISNVITNAMDEVNSRTFEVNVARSVDILGIQKYFEWRKDYKAFHVFVYSVIYREIILPIYIFANKIYLIFLSILIYPFIFLGVVFVGWLDYNYRFLRPDYYFLYRKYCHIF